MLVLGIESSCDETAGAIVSEQRNLLANRVRSQLAEHQPYGGVVPEIAARAHMAHLEPLLQEALSDANCGYEQLDAIAATTGPGLIGGVIVGTMAGKALASIYRKPFIAVNHLEGHALTARLTDQVEFPYLLLLVSGGHCQYLLVRGLGDYTLLGGTIDDALGEAYDKVAKMLGLGYPGGPALEAQAQRGDALRFDLPRPLRGQENCNFSFSGLKTAVRYQLREMVSSPDQLTPRDVADMAASFQSVVIELVMDRTRHALRQVQDADITALVVAGGVAANQAIKAALQELADEASLPLLVPPPKLCTDNAAMIAWAGLEYFRAGRVSALDVEPRARWPLASAA